MHAFAVCLVAFIIRAWIVVTTVLWLEQAEPCSFIASIIRARILVVAYLWSVHALPSPPIATIKCALIPVRAVLFNFIASSIYIAIGGLAQI